MQCLETRLFRKKIVYRNAIKSDVSNEHIDEVLTLIVSLPLLHLVLVNC